MLAAVKTTNASMTSRNWAGYAIDATGVTAISASWVVPKIQCSTTGSAYPLSAGVVVWVGFDGLTGTAMIPEQLGTDSLCYNGSPTYDAWEEDPSLSPTSATNHAQGVFGNELSGGDHITASIAYFGNDKFQLSIKDIATGDTRTFNVLIHNTPRTSAEWIVEDPWYTRTGNYLPLPTFQPVTFSDCSAAVNNVAGSILQNNASPISMTDSNGNVIVTPQGVNQAGTSFQVNQIGSPVPEVPSILGILLSAFAAGIFVLRKKKKST